MLLEQLAISHHLLRVEKPLDLLVGAIPDGARLGRLASLTAATLSAASAVGWRTTLASSAPSATPSTPLTLRITTLTISVYSERLYLHRFVSEDGADSSLLRGIELQCLRQHRHPLVDHLTRIQSLPARSTLWLRILRLRAGAGCERDTPGNDRYKRQTPGALWNFPTFHRFPLVFVVRVSRADDCSLPSELFYSRAHHQSTRERRGTHPHRELWLSLAGVNTHCVAGALPVRLKAVENKTGNVRGVHLEADAATGLRTLSWFEERRAGIWEKQELTLRADETRPMIEMYKLANEPDDNRAHRNGFDRQSFVQSKATVSWRGPNE